MWKHTGTFKRSHLCVLWDLRPQLARLEKDMLYKHEDSSSLPQTHVKASRGSASVRGIEGEEGGGGGVEGVGE